METSKAFCVQTMLGEYSKTVFCIKGCMYMYHYSGCITLWSQKTTVLQNALLNWKYPPCDRSISDYVTSLGFEIWCWEGGGCLGREKKCLWVIGTLRRVILVLFLLCVIKVDDGWDDLMTGVYIEYCTSMLEVTHSNKCTYTSHVTMCTMSSSNKDSFPPSTTSNRHASETRSFSKAEVHLLFAHYQYHIHRCNSTCPYSVHEHF